jgi:hypothetical protein
LQGTPTNANVGTTSNIVISVSNGRNSASLPAFSITVSAPAVQPPTISGTPSTAATVGAAYTFTPTTTNPSGGTLTFSITNQPSWAGFSETTGELQGTPTNANVGTTSNIVISVSDGRNSASLPAFSITVSAPATQPPTISGAPSIEATVGMAYAFTPTTTNPSGGTLFFSITNKPSWANFNITNGRLSGTPGAGDVGTTSGIVISVSDDRNSASLPAFSLTVSEPPVTPPPPLVISGTPDTSVAATHYYEFEPAVSEADDDATLTFSITNKPSWAQFSETNGHLYGTPSEADLGTTSNIVISVTDGWSSDSLPPFSITVTDRHVGTADLSWTAPTLNADGSPLTNLLGFRVYHSTVDPGPNPEDQTFAEEISLPDPAPDIHYYAFDHLLPGAHYFWVTAVNTFDMESKPSPVLMLNVQ